MSVRGAGFARAMGLLPLMVVFATVGCSDIDSPTSVTPDVDFQAAGSHAAILGSTKGSGHTPFAGGLRVFTFTAKQFADGPAQGRFRIGLNAINAWFTAEVTCVSFDGNTAWVAGIIADTNVPNLVQVGSVSEFYVIDNGEGSAAADIVSTAAFNQEVGDDLAFCEAQPLVLAPRTVTQGNVQVSTGP